MEKLQAFFDEGHQFIFFCHLFQILLMTFFLEFKKGHFKILHK